MNNVTKHTEKTPVVASPKINISHQRSRKAAEAMKKIEGNKEQETAQKPRNINKILVAIDGSEKSDEALDFTLNLGQTVKAEIELLTVTQNIVVPWFGSVEASAITMDPSYLNEYYEDQKKYSEEILDKAMKKAERIYRA